MHVNSVVFVDNCVPFEKVVVISVIIVFQLKLRMEHIVCLNWLLYQFSVVVSEFDIVFQVVKSEV